MWTGILIAVIGLAAGGAAIASRMGTPAASYLLLMCTILAAGGGLISVVVTLTGSASADRHQARFGKQQKEMAHDISRLAEFTQSSVEAARAQTAQPSVEFLLPDGKSGSVVTWEPRLVEQAIDIEGVVSTAREEALATLPTAPAKGSNNRAATLIGIAAILESSGLMGGAITEQDRMDFRAEVDSYGEKLTRWLGDYATWHREMAQVWSARFRFTNAGRVPAHDVTVQLHFPDSFTGVEEAPSFPDLPTQPRFKRRNLFDLTSSMSALSALNYPIGRVNVPRIGGNVSGPRFGKGSLLVEFSIKKLQHGLSDETDEPAILRMPSPGSYNVPWEIHADNMSEPATGELGITVQSTTARSEVLRSWEAVLATIPPALRPGTDEG